MSQKPEHISIPKGPPKEAAENYAALRALGLGNIIELGSEHWTDYNEHDPGITMLEALAYAITDLGYRTHFSIQDVLAQLKNSAQEQATYQFPKASSILSSSPVTVKDMRRSLTDIDGVANAWLRPVSGFQPIRGVYKILIQSSQEHGEQDSEELKLAVQECFANLRNLGEDYSEIVIAKEVELALSMELELDPGVQAEEVVAEALTAIDSFLQGAVQFHSLQDMQALQGGRIDHVFEGPTLAHGFVPINGLQDKSNKVSALALIPLVREVPGVLSVLRLEIANLPVPSGSGVNRIVNIPDHLPLRFTQTYSLGEDEVAVLGPLNKFEFEIQVGGLPQTLDLVELQHEMETLALEQPSPKQRSQERDLPIPQGKFRNLEAYYTVQYDLPEIYRLKDGALSANSDESRHAESNQLRGFLSIFDQIMANYLSQLAHLGDLFSWAPNQARTYFFQGLERSLHEISNLLVGAPSGQDPTKGEAFTDELREAVIAYHKQLGKISETEQDFVLRRNQFLDHLLARFGWTIQDFVGGLGRDNAAGLFLAESKAQFLWEFPGIGAARGKGGDYLSGPFTAARLSGLRRLVESVLGIVPENPENHALNNRIVLSPNNPKAPQKLGDFQLFNLAGTAINMPFLMEIGRDVNNYKVITAENRKLTFRVLSEELSLNDTMVFWTPATFDSGDAARESAAELAGLIQEYNKTSERVHVLDHVLLRPSPDQASFGMQLLNEYGNPWLSTDNWYPEAELKAVLELNGGKKPNYQIVYGKAFLEGGGPQFTFTVSATKDGKPHPVYPPNGVVLPAEIPLNSNVFISNESGELFKSYIKKHYSNVFHQPASFGADLLLDFIQQELPADWESAGKSTEMVTWGRFSLKVIAEILYPLAKGDKSVLGSSVMEGIGKWIAEVPPVPEAEELILFSVVYPYLLNDQTRIFLSALSGWATLPNFSADLQAVILPALGNGFLSTDQLATLKQKIGQLTPSKNDPEQYRANALDLMFVAFMEANPDVEGDVGKSLDTIFQLDQKLDALSSGALAYLASVGRNMGKGFLRQFFRNDLKEPARLGTAILIDFDLTVYPAGLEKGLIKLTQDDLEKFAFKMMDNDPSLKGSDLRQALLGKDPGGILNSQESQAELESMAQHLLGAFLRGVFGNHDPTPVELGLFLIERKPADNQTVKDPTTNATLSKVAEQGLLMYCQTQFPGKWKDEFSLGNAVSGIFLHQQTANTPIPGGQELANVQEWLFAWYLRNILLKSISPGMDSLKSLLGLSATGSPDRLKTLVRQGTEFFVKEGYVPGPTSPEDLGKLLDKVFVTDTQLPTSRSALNSMAASGAFLLAEYLENCFPTPSSKTRFSTAITDLVDYFINGKGANAAPKVADSKKKSAKPGGKGKDGKNKKDADSTSLSVDPAALSEFEKWYLSLQAQASGKKGESTSSTHKWSSSHITGSWIANGKTKAIIGRGDQLGFSDFGWLGSQALAIYLQSEYSSSLAAVPKLVTALSNDIITPQALSGMPLSKVKNLALAGYYLMLQVFVSKFSDIIGQDLPLGVSASTWLSYSFPATSTVVGKKPKTKSEAATTNKVASGDSEIIYDLVLQYRSAGGWVKLNSDVTYRDAETIEVAIRNLVEDVASINGGKQALNTLVRPLIKPISTTAVEDLNDPVDPYSFLATVLLPDWPTRFQKKTFRALLENTILEHAPAHLSLKIYWLDKGEMQDFEDNLKTWKSAEPKTPASHAAAKVLARWIIALNNSNSNSN